MQPSTDTILSYTFSKMSLLRWKFYTIRQPLNRLTPTLMKRREYQKSFTVGCLSWHWKYARWNTIVALTTENMTDASVAYHCILVKYESNGRNI